MEILHLEDDGPLREIMHIALASADPNLKMKQFTDSDAAVAYIEQNINSITLYVLDVRVPGELDGLGVAKKIRELGSTRPILVTSAYRKPDQDKLEAYDCQWMAKPWHLLDAPQAILLLAKDDKEDTPSGHRMQSTSVSEVLLPKSASNRPKTTENTAPNLEARQTFSQLPPSQRKTQSSEDAAKPFAKQLQEIMESDTHSMQPVQDTEDDKTVQEAVEESGVHEATQEYVVEEPKSAASTLPENPLPFDEPLALADTDSGQEHTDLIVTVSRMENPIVPGDDADTAPDEEAEEETSAGNVYKSDDAPIVEPFSPEQTDTDTL